MKPVYLAYFDKSGNTGLDLRNAQQPIFALGALLVRAEHQICIDAVEPLITTGDESLLEVIEWMDQQIKKRPGTESGVD